MANGVIEIEPYNYNSVIQGTWTVLSGALWRPYAMYNTTTHADGDGLDYYVDIPDDGTYTLCVRGGKDTDMGILEVSLSIDGVLSTFDFYGVSAQTTFAQVAGLSLTKGIQTLTAKINGKNVASSNHKVCFSRIMLYRTA